ncbi:hypothetical protein ACVIW2_001468 [Bradyrhizobium huanghuaihaiense]
MKTKSKSTERVRRFRERQANGRFRVTLDLDEAERDALEAVGVVKAWNSPAEDRAAIAAVALLKLREWLSNETRFIKLSEDLLSLKPNQDEEE